MGTLPCVTTGRLGELLTSDGDLDILRLDGEFEHTEEKWRYGEPRELLDELCTVVAVDLGPERR
ncbi:hypothetical protein ACIQV3_38310 [Streptomyces sp. NPDC099050]|uniref:hypothetical protein n=1 Tax=Streptomyces sp. NPDC099050 TaxID=3366100 RepID=UPI003809A4B4